MRSWCCHGTLGGIGCFVHVCDRLTGSRSAFPAVNDGTVDAAVAMLSSVRGFLPRRARRCLRPTFRNRDGCGFGVCERLCDGGKYGASHPVGSGPGQPTCARHATVPGNGHRQPLIDARDTGVGPEPSLESKAFPGFLISPALGRCDGTSGCLVAGPKRSETRCRAVSRRPSGTRRNTSSNTATTATHSPPSCSPPAPSPAKPQNVNSRPNPQTPRHAHVHIRSCRHARTHARPETHVKILLNHSLDPRFHTDLSEKLCAPAYSAKFLDAHRFENGDMLRPSRPATR